jgi:hypothetical protein
LKRGTLSVILAVILIIAGLIVISISLSSTPRNQTLVNTAVQVPAKSRYSEYGISIPYFLNGNSNGKINGSMLMFQQCCVRFNIFTAAAWQNFISEGFNSTNSTNSPVFTLNSTAIDAKNGVSPTFTFVPDPSKTYALVFFNENRSLWNSNSSVVFHVVSDITLNYYIDPIGALIYLGAALLIAGIALIFVRIKFYNK